MKHLLDFYKAVLAGIMIGIGGVVYLSCESKLVGAVLFSIGLLTIVLRGFHLFTGKVGYLVVQPLAYLGFLAMVWVGNFVGTGIVGLLMRHTRYAPKALLAAKLWEAKAQDSLVSLFILAIFCGMLMYVAVDCCKICKQDGSLQIAIVVLAVVVFILSGFEHCIANMFYGWFACCWTPDLLLRLVVITLGNAVGGTLVPLVQRWER